MRNKLLWYSWGLSPLIFLANTTGNVPSIPVPALLYFLNFFFIYFISPKLKGHHHSILISCCQRKINRYATTMLRQYIWVRGTSQLLLVPSTAPLPGSCLWLPSPCPCMPSSQVAAQGNRWSAGLLSVQQKPRTSDGAREAPYKWAAKKREVCMCILSLFG